MHSPKFKFYSILYVFVIFLFTIMWHDILSGVIQQCLKPSLGIDHFITVSIYACFIT